MPQDALFDLDLAHGRCVGVRIPNEEEGLDRLAAELLAEERAFARTLAPRRRRTWVGGRAALREVLARSGLTAPPIFADDRGAPGLPAGIAGSVSHKEDLAVALVALDGAARLGVDVEVDMAPMTDVSSRVLTPEELDELASLDPPARDREVLLRFSAKEAIYKAIDPFVRRFVGFQEVSVDPRPDGSARVTSRLRPGEGPFAIDVRWRRWDGMVLTTARASVVV
ncbi:MAG TPA: 4'-phosphopantetheinyl transferase superfamily protein [Polyangiaceae bacterium]|nr:4'-phosphopantetheinyl transferase superfamily protein [Polyangiaceae bacterium]